MGMKIVLKDHSGTTLVYKSPSEAYVYFAEVIWSENEEKVAILVTGATEFPVAYDLKARRRVPFEPYRKRMEAAIARDYQPASQQDDRMI